MGALLELDRSLFLWLNRSIANSPFDWLMPFFAWNKLFLPALVVLAIGLIWRGGAKGRLFVTLGILAVALTDGFVCDAVKDLVGRSRPFETIPEARLLVGKGSSRSFPSSHAANWFAAATLVWVYYPKVFWLTLTAACVVAFSRVYVGVHYPSDVVGGALVGVACATVLLLFLEKLWRWAGRSWFPLWWARLPSLLPLKGGPEGHEELYLSGTDADHERLRARQWERFAYVAVFALLLMRWAYIGNAKIELSEDEAYQWLWSQNLDLSYYSKPPLIAYAQFIGTSLFGHTEFGVRMLSPLMAAILSLLLVRWFSREVSVRAGIILLGMLCAAPMLSVGATLLTIDAPSVFFWGLAIIAGWNALQRYSLGTWILVGLFTGLGFLSKYVALFQVLSWALIFWLNRDARQQLRRAGPWVALAILFASFAPVIIWNAQHDWITVTHLADRGGLNKDYRFTLRFFIDFVGSEFFLLNPVFVAVAAAGVVFYGRRLEQHPLPAYLLCMGGPVFVFYFLLSLRSRVHPNWIAPSVISILGIAALYLTRKWREDPANARKMVIAGLAFGLPVVALLHDTNLIGKLIGFPIPARRDPLVRVRGWTDAARILESERLKVAEEGKEVFVIGAHYGITSVMTFYNPSAKEAQLKGKTFTYFLSSREPVNQFFFWPSYEDRKGQNAIFIRRATSLEPAPESLVEQFSSVTDLGLREVQFRGQVIRTVQLFACRDLL